MRCLEDTVVWWGDSDITHTFSQQWLNQILSIQLKKSFSTLTHTHIFLSCHLERWLRRLLAEWQEWNLSQEYNYYCPFRHFIWNHVLIWCGEDMIMLFTHKGICKAEKEMSSHNDHWSNTFQTGNTSITEEKAPVIELSVSNRTLLKGPLGCGSF